MSEWCKHCNHLRPLDDEPTFDHSALTCQPSSTTPHILSCLSSVQEEREEDVATSVSIMTDALQPTHPPEAENWDDDFVFQAQGEVAEDAPVRPGVVGTQRDSIAWDEDDDDPILPPKPPKPIPRAGKEPEEVHWGDSDDDHSDPQNRRGLAASHASLDPSPGKWTTDDDDFAPASLDVDKTVTLKNRPPTLPTVFGGASAMSSSASLQSSSQQHVHLPQSHSRSSPTPYSPASPTISSAFSMGASSTAHLALRSPKSITASFNPAPPPVTYNPPPRARRRLRKKSRPPQADILELEDVRGFQEELEEGTGSNAGPSALLQTSSSRPLSAAVPHHHHPYQFHRQSQFHSPDPDTSVSTTGAPGTSPPSDPSSPSAKAHLLSRIGSMKNWPRRKSRNASQSNISLDGPTTPPRDRAMTPEPQGMGLDLHGATDSDLSRRGSLSRASVLSKKKQAPVVGIGKVLSRIASSSNIETSTPRPMSMMAQGPSRPSTRPQAATMGRSSSNPFVAAPIDATPTPSSFLGIRKRIGEHRRNKSTGADSIMGDAVSPLPPLPPLPPSTPPRLPPIELSPPSPPKMFGSASQQPLSSFMHLSQFSASPSRSPGGTSSLGRANGMAVIAGGVGSMRRNSLGDLKIPARISKAQVGLKNNLTMVREFAANVEQLKELQNTQKRLVAEINLSCGAAQSAGNARPPGAAAPQILNKDLAKMSTAARLKKIEEQYSLWWECAELLIELGGGADSSSAADNTNDPSASPDDHHHHHSPPHSAPPPIRERAVTLASSPTATSSPWRERSGLSPRQLALLKEMLTTPDPSTLSLPDFTLRQAQQVGAMMHSPYIPLSPPPTRMYHPASSAVTLPESTGSSSAFGGGSRRGGGDRGGGVSSTTDHQVRPQEGKARRASRVGLSGIKDILKAALKKAPPPPPLPVVDTSSVDSRSRNRSQTHGGLPVPPPPPNTAVLHKWGRAAKTSTGAHTVAGGDDHQVSSPPPPVPPPPPRPFSSTATRKSPRRPSLASIFRLGSGNGSRKKSRQEVPPLPQQTSSSAAETTEDDDLSDWDRMDSASDLGGSVEANTNNQATVKGRKTLVPQHTPSPPPPLPQLYSSMPAASESSLSLRGSPRHRPTRLPLAITEEAGHTPLANKRASSAQSRPGSKAGGAGRNRQAINSSLPPMPFSSLLAVASASTSTDMIAAESAASDNKPFALSQPQSPPSSDVRLALTPENIRPLLECSREVSARLNECVAELKSLSSSSSTSI